MTGSPRRSGAKTCSWTSITFRLGRFRGLLAQPSGCVRRFPSIIGPNWLDAKDDDGRRRFDNPDDYVAVEIAAALARNIRVIPVLVDGAQTPKADELPDSIKPLVRRNAVEVRNTNFGHDAESLIPKIHEALKTARPSAAMAIYYEHGRAISGRGHWRMVAGSATALLLVGWIGYQLGVPVWVPWTPRAEQPDAPSAEQGIGRRRSRSKTQGRGSRATAARCR